MYDQESPNEAKPLPLPTSPPPTAQQDLRLMSEKAKLKFYLMEGGMAECYGFSVVGRGPDKRLVIKDPEKTKRFPEDTKAILRELYLELR
jgi:hypothetical protein